MKLLLLLFVISLPSLNGRAVSNPMEPMDSAMQLLSRISHTEVIELTKKRAQNLYGREYGFNGVTDTVVTSITGEQLLYLRIKGDGNCGFYASGVSRQEFVETITRMVNKEHDPYHQFLAERTKLVDAVENLTAASDIGSIEQSINSIKVTAENGDKVDEYIQHLKDFNTKKTQYYNEFFIERRNALEKQIKALQTVSGIQQNTDLNTAIETLAVFVKGIEVSNKDNKIAKIRADVKALLERVNGVQQQSRDMTNQSRKISEALKKFEEIFTENDVMIYDLIKKELINKISNLTLRANTYEAFLTALTLELFESAVNNELNSQDQVIAAVNTIFSQNRGANTWFPAGLLGAIHTELKLEFNIWGPSENSMVKLLQASGINGSKITGSNVRNIFHKGNHYDMLIPLLPED